MVAQRCATGIQRLERDGLIVGRALLPAPIEEAAPCECQCPDRGLLGLARVAWLLVVPLGPAGRPARLHRPVDTRLPEDLGTLAAPGPPELRAAPFGHRGDPGIVLEFG